MESFRILAKRLVSCDINFRDVQISTRVSKNSKINVPYPDSLVFQGQKKFSPHHGIRNPEDGSPGDLQRLITFAKSSDFQGCEVKFRTDLLQ